jgi:hypothetical protein
LRASGFDTRVSSTSYIAVALATSQDPSHRPAAALSPDAVTFKTTRSWFQLFVVNVQTGTTSESFRRFGMVDCEGPTIPPSDLLGVCWSEGDFAPAIQCGRQFSGLAVTRQSARRGGIHDDY